MTERPEITMDCHTVCVTVQGTKHDSLEDVADVAERLTATAVARLDEANRNMFDLEKTAEEAAPDAPSPEGRYVS